MMASDLATIRTATAADATAIVALWDTAFESRLSPDQWLVDRDRLAHTLVAVVDDTICGTVWGRAKRLRETGDETALVHCIGSVAVAPQARGQGLARRLVQASLAGAGDSDWALLFTGTPDVYRSSGFESFTMRRTVSGRWTPPSFAAQRFEVDRSIVGAGTFDWARLVYENSRTGVTLAPVRDRIDWAMAEVRLAGAVVYTVCSGSLLLGYAVAHTASDGGRVTGMIDEMAVPATTSEYEVWHALLAAVAADWDAAGVTMCEIAVPEAAAGRAQDRAIGDFAPEVVSAVDRTGMTRGLRREPRIDGIRHLTAADYF